MPDLILRYMGSWPHCLQLFTANYLLHIVVDALAIVYAKWATILSPSLLSCPASSSMMVTRHGPWADDRPSDGGH